MWECFCCQQIGYMEASFKFFPKRHEDGYHPICMICVPYVIDCIKGFEEGQKKLTEFEEE